MLAACIVRFFRHDFRPTEFFWTLFGSDSRRNDVCQRLRPDNGRSVPKRTASAAMGDVIGINPSARDLFAVTYGRGTTPSQ